MSAEPVLTAPPRAKKATPKSSPKIKETSTVEPDQTKSVVSDCTVHIPPIDPTVTTLDPVAAAPVAPASVGFMLGFPPDLFRDHGSYYELTFAQRSPEWHGARKKRVTASIFAQAAGCSPYKTRTQLLREMAGVARPADFAFFQKQAMMHGTLLEPYVRDWYETSYKKVVEERGLVIPKWCTRIGVSVDGYLPKSNGIIEIKCPVSMYPELVDHSHRLEKGEIFPPFYRAHIKPDHYAQMQGGMAILGCDFCDYVVYVDRTKDACVTRIMRDRAYWDNELFPKLMSFIVEMDQLTAQRELAEAAAISAENLKMHSAVGQARETLNTSQEDNEERISAEDENPPSPATAERAAHDEESK